MLNMEWKDLKDKHLGEECFVIGNGKSLAGESNEFLRSYPSFGTNRVYLKLTPTYFVCINPTVASQWKDEIEKLDCTKFVTDKVYIPGAIPLHSNYTMAFSRNPQDHVCEGNTVTYVCLQLAYFMGFSAVYLVGVDHSYNFKGSPHERLVATGEDQNHFDPTYFSNGVKWDAPDLDGSEKAYKIAKRVFESDHRRIINITPSSKLDVFERGDI